MENSYLEDAEIEIVGDTEMDKKNAEKVEELLKDDPVVGFVQHLLKSWEPGVGWVHQAGRDFQGRSC